MGIIFIGIFERIRIRDTMQNNANVKSTAVLMIFTLMLVNPKITRGIITARNIYVMERNLICSSISPISAYL